MKAKHAAFSPLKPKVVLCVAAHADDIDFCMSGSVAKWASHGSAVYYLILTNGERGTDDKSVKPKKLTKTRQQEQRDAARMLGVKDVSFCDYKDCCLNCDENVTRDIVRAIRELKPDTVLTMDPSMLYSAEWGYINHPDHRAAGQAALDATYPMARDHLSFPELARKYSLETHKVSTILLTNYNEPNYFENITGHLKQKHGAMDTHISQMKDAAKIHKLIDDQARHYGKLTDAAYAEPYVRIDIAM